MGMGWSQCPFDPLPICRPDQTIISAWMDLYSRNPDPNSVNIRIFNTRKVESRLRRLLHPSISFVWFLKISYCCICLSLRVCVSFVFVSKCNFIFPWICIWPRSTLVSAYDQSWGRTSHQSAAIHFTKPSKAPSIEKKSARNDFEQNPSFFSVQLLWKAVCISKKHKILLFWNFKNRKQLCWFSPVQKATVSSTLQKCIGRNHLLSDCPSKHLSMQKPTKHVILSYVNVTETELNCQIWCA